MDDLNQMCMGNVAMPYSRNAKCRSIYDCRRDNTPIDFDKFPLGMAYVPWQKFQDLYSNEHEALKHGTIFKELFLPWEGWGR